jgi:hypothetical protein
MLQCKRVSASLADAISAFKTYAMLHFDSELRVFKTKGEREGAIEDCLSDLLAYKTAADIVYELAVIVVTDIDKAGFSLSRTLEAVAIHSTPERKLR